MPTRCGLLTPPVPAASSSRRSPASPRVDAELLVYEQGSVRRPVSGGAGGTEAVARAIPHIAPDARVAAVERREVEPVGHHVGANAIVAARVEQSVLEGRAEASRRFACRSRAGHSPSCRRSPPPTMCRSCRHSASSRRRRAAASGLRGIPRSPAISRSRRPCVVFSRADHRPDPDVEVLVIEAGVRPRGRSPVRSGAGVDHREQDVPRLGVEPVEGTAGEEFLVPNRALGNTEF